MFTLLSAKILRPFKNEVTQYVPDFIEGSLMPIEKQNSGKVYDPSGLETPSEAMLHYKVCGCV